MEALARQWGRSEEDFFLRLLGSWDDAGGVVESSVVNATVDLCTDAYSALAQKTAELVELDVRARRGLQSFGCGFKPTVMILRSAASRSGRDRFVNGLLWVS